MGAGGGGGACVEYMTVRGWRVDRGGTKAGTNSDMLLGIAALIAGEYEVRESCGLTFDCGGAFSCNATDEEGAEAKTTLQFFFPPPLRVLPATTDALRAVLVPTSGILARSGSSLCSHSRCLMYAPTRALK